MRRRSVPAVLAAAALLAGACSGDDEQGLEPLDTPEFAPEETDGGPDTTTTTAAETSTPASGASDGDGDGDGEGDDPGPTSTLDGGSTASTSSTTAVPQERVAVDDPDDDAVGGVEDDPPPWTDLAGITLVRQGNAYALRVQLAGGQAPETSDGESTMNIASFYDVDGDGGVDYEIWANLGPEGWGGAWYDDENNAAFGEDSNVSIEVDGDEVVILFPDVMLDQPDRFRFSVASEYGDMGVLGSSFARRDDVPNDDQVVAFPG